LLSAEVVVRLHQDGVFLFPLLGYEPCTQKLATHKRPGCASPSLFTANRLGMRGSEPPKAWYRSKTIIALGSSTTICQYNTDSLAWPYRLQRGGAWVGNAGTAGQTSRVHLVIMRETLKHFKPSAFVALVGLADLNVCMRKRDREHGNSFDEAVIKRFTRHPGLYTAFENIALFRLAYWTFNRMRPLQIVNSNPANPFDLKTGVDSVGRDTAWMAKALEDFKSNLDTMAQLSQEHGVKLALITQPTLFRESAEWEDKLSFEVEWEGSRRWGSASTHYRRLQDFNRATMAMQGRHGAVVINLANAIPSDPELFFDGFHFTDDGSKLVGDMLADSMVSL
jgi:hypothetical protein